MKKRLLFIFCLVSGVGGIAFGQTRTVTNADLEGYKQKRLRAEKDLRENYAMLGFPSPEELQRQYDEDAKERDELSARLREARLERERIAAELESARSAVDSYVYIPDDDYSYLGFYTGFYYPFYGGLAYPKYPRHVHNYGRKRGNYAPMWLPMPNSPSYWPSRSNRKPLLKPRFR